MQTAREFEKFVSAETDAERSVSIQRLMNLSPSWQKNLCMWQLLNLLPTRVEKSRLAHLLRIPRRPSSEWSMVSFLMNDLDQDIIGNAINSLTFSKNRALGHRTMKYFSSLERPQRVLYCLARFAEETNDHRFAKFLAPFLANDLSDAFLARSFNALFRLGVKDEVALRVAGELVASHIDATNMDRKAAVSAIVYLCFAGSEKEITELKSVRDRVSIPELRRLLNWGFSEIESTGKEGFSTADACRFFERAMSENEPNFTGFGCFKTETLQLGLSKFLDKQTEAAAESLTKTVLALGEATCIDFLAQHPIFGLKAAIAEKKALRLALWRQFMPVHAPTFEKSVRNPELYEAWHSEDPEILYTVLAAEDFVGHKKTGLSWQSHFEAALGKDPQLANDLLCAQILAYERALLPGGNQTICESLCGLIFENVKANIASFAKSKKQAELYQAFIDTVYGVCVGGNFPARFFVDLFTAAPFTGTSWAFNAFALCAPNLEQPVLQKAIASELEFISIGLKRGELAREDFVLEVVSRFQGILVGAERFQVSVSKETLEALKTLATTIQGILDAVDQSIGGKDEPDAQDDEGADWAGHVSVDKIILRWNAVLQVCLKADFTPDERQDTETLLREAMRVAPHIEKRWIVRALTKLGSDDAVKAILYQGLQHVDVDFVAHTVRELLPSKHPRAQQALIRCVGRNTISDDLKLLILDDITLENPSEILLELRTLEILRLPQHIDDAIRDAVGRVAALIDVDQTLSKTEDPMARFSSFDVDLIIKKLVPEADSLSVDTRSALRTAEMILIQSREWGAEAVDLSPIVNMHCKAVELAMRETFEAFTDAVIRKGNLSRKLDLLGYARPIPEKMQIFEDTLASLPIIKTIPYFSKFKLRKMLRAICLYRPGKRFTLDGPKAFALLFLVASRKSCPFGLEGILGLDFESDQALFDFIKLVHSLQDSRNRAVHEGLTWEAKDEIEGMRSQAYKIIEICIRLGRYLNRTNGSQSAGSSGSSIEMGA